MSTEAGGKVEVDRLLGEAKELFERAAEEERQLELLSPVTPEEMAEARDLLGPEAGRLAVLREAREQRKKGRPKGSRNKRTDDFARYVLQFGQDPAITLMQIQSTDPEVLIQASEQPKVHSFRKSGEPNMVIERMSYAEAQALRVRCAEALMSFIHSKKPVAIDATIRGVIIQEEIGELRRTVGTVIDGDIVGVARPGGDA